MVQNVFMGLGEEGAFWCEKRQSFCAKSHGDPLITNLAAYAAVPEELLAPQMDNDGLIPTRENYAAILDCLDRHLICLRAYFEAELLAFLHRLSVHDGKARCFIHGDGANQECAFGNFASGVFSGRAAGDALSRFPANRPKRISVISLHLE